MILGATLERAPFLEPVTRFLHADHVEDAIAGVIGGVLLTALARLGDGAKTP